MLVLLSLFVSHVIFGACTITIFIVVSSVDRHAVALAELEAQVLDLLVFLCIKLVSLTVVALVAAAPLYFSFVHFARVLFMKLAQIFRYVLVRALESCNEILSILTLVRCDECYSAACLAGSTSATDAMHIVLKVARARVVDD